MTTPYRPQTEKDLWLRCNGQPVFLGALVSGATTTPVNNATTATPFNYVAQGGQPVPASPAPITGNLQGTLAGKVLLFQPVAAGLVLPSRYPSMSPSALNPIIALQTATFSASAMPGVAVAGGERVIITMQSDYGWVQWLSSSGSATCLVWELI